MWIQQFFFRLNWIETDRDILQILKLSLCLLYLFYVIHSIHTYNQVEQDKWMDTILFWKKNNMPTCQRMRGQRTIKILIKSSRHLTRWLKDLRTASKKKTNAQNGRAKGPEHWIYLEKRNLDTAWGQTDFVHFSTYI